MHTTGTREEWLKARLDLLKAEKEHTRHGDELAEQRRALPWVRVEKEYRFDTDAGPALLKDLFRGRSQLLIYHFMFGPDYTAGCPSCSSIADGFNGFAIHLAHHDVMLWAVSRAPLKKLQGFRKRMGWSFPWASSFGGDFNYDYSVGFTEKQQREQGLDYNYQHEPARPEIPNDPTKGAGPFAVLAGTDVATYIRERPGLSAFAMQDGAVHHTYSAYARGLDGLWGMYQWLDRAPLGRNEGGGGDVLTLASGNADAGLWWKHHDRYEQD